MSCQICFEDYDADTRPPLLLACCRGGHLCRECLVSHLEKGNARCIVCPKRPTRLFVNQCIETTPSDFLAQLHSASANGDDGVVQPKVIPLKQGELFDELVALCEKKGDAEAARDLDKQLQHEIQMENLQKEEEDRRLALKMQDEEEIETQQLKQRLTKTHASSSASIYTSATNKGTKNNKKLLDELKSNKRITNFFTTTRGKENSNFGGSTSSTTSSSVNHNSGSSNQNSSSSSSSSGKRSRDASISSGSATSKSKIRKSAMGDGNGPLEIIEL